ncbi:AbrB/MazE/SpoVT family DNA-binding domain-containing protein [Paeniglutamicibacter antarcticus]|uniref:AbrB/MazE/SpoVT family DNA-binding domain-containing protein n=2 Tax=Arthrobacter terrae TaxID=2935737 RepID=A0A931CIK2_9MICC|nr:AbrB/MazE/SpoVT family DNA-binding domain-containing protein [Arthrobacter terrae]
MAIAKLTSKGQITVPLEVRKRLGLRPGSRLDFVQTSDGGYTLEALGGSLSSLEGMFRSVGTATPVSIEEMDDAIAAESAASAFPHVPDEADSASAADFAPGHGA